MRSPDSTAIRGCGHDRTAPAEPDRPRRGGGWATPDGREVPDDLRVWRKGGFPPPYSEG